MQTSEYFENDPADYVFDDFYFYLTCGGYPEQYDVFHKPLGYLPKQVGYVRLRGGNLYCTHPDVGGRVIYHHDFGGYHGAFPSEELRQFHLETIATKLKQFLEGVSYEYS